MRTRAQLLVNFGYPEGTTDLFPEGLTNAQLAELYGVVWIYVGTHFVCFLPMLPVLFLGWEEAGVVWRTGFVLGAIGAHASKSLTDLVSCPKT